MGLSMMEMFISKINQCLSVTFLPWTSFEGVENVAILECTVKYWEEKNVLDLKGYSVLFYFFRSVSFII